MKLRGSQVRGADRLAMSVEADRGAELESDEEGAVQTLFAPANVVDPIQVTVMLTTEQAKAAELSCSIATNEDATERPVPLRRFLVPWLEAPSDQSLRPGEANPLDRLSDRKIAELDGGSWGRGHRLFHSEQVGCAKCHVSNEQGQLIGPDLRNLVHRDYSSVLRDIVDPSYAINPDYISHLVALDDGRVLTGVLRTEGGQLLLGNEQGKSERLVADRIDRMQPASTSVMPKGLLDKLDAGQQRDLMTYLLLSPPRMPLDSPLKAPPIRSSADVAMALAGAPKRSKRHGR